MSRIDPFFGPYHLGAGWVPSLRYLARRARVLDLIEQAQPTTLLEVGCGAGALLTELSLRGFNCVGLESSAPALAVAREIAQDSHARYPLTDQHDIAWAKRFAMLAALDVLEHIEDEVSALRQWHGWLEAGGKLLLSVPAHSKRWGPGDQWAGHFRRYDAAPLKQLLDACGFKIEHVECYGFPIANLTEWLGKRGYSRMLKRRGADAEKNEATALSGVERGLYLRMFRYMRWWPIRWMLGMGLAFQKVFLKTDWGSGYIVVARKR